MPYRSIVMLVIDRLYAPADFDGDGDVDRDDFGHFQACLSGPAIPQVNPTCPDADLDQDSDVDQADFALLQRCFRAFHD